MSSMLHRSFKPAKCKTALKLAASRMKLLKNKKEGEVKKLRRDLANLLNSGQEQTARIRVEHVVREEKMMAAYDLVELYCELIITRLPIIESQKNCPIDLKEAIASVIFASPRFSDIPELTDVRKQITSKYGKEFVSAAIELRPDCGVNRLLVEKLSAKAPDGPTKIKILTAIAEEHNIKWEPKSFGENDGKPQDLLVGPNNFEKATYMEPSQVHVPPAHDEMAPPDLRAASQPKPMHDISTNSYEQNASRATREAVGNQSATTSRMSGSEIRPSGTGSEMNGRDSNSGNRSAFPMGKQNWNMEFKDAASAAQAAAESAELASMAARAAAELSNRENMERQYSSGSHGSSGSRFREVPQEYAHDDKHLSTDSVKSSFHRKSSGTHNEQITATEPDTVLVGAPNENYKSSHENAVKHAQSASLASSSSFGGDNPFAHGSQMADIYQHSNSFEHDNMDLHEVNIKKQESRTEVDFVTGLHGDDDSNTENSYHVGDATPISQSRKASSSHFISPNDDHDHYLNSYGQKMRNKAVEDIFVTDEGSSQRNTMEASSYNDASVAFDDSGSEEDDYKFDFENKYKGEKSSLFLSSPGSKSQVDPLENTSPWRHGQEIDKKESSPTSDSHSSVVSERCPTASTDKEDLLPFTFDDSDNAVSDSEVDFIKPTVSGTSDFRNPVFDQSANLKTSRSSSRNDKSVGSDRKSWLSPSLVGSDTVEEQSERKVDINTESDKTFSFDDLRTSQPSQLTETLDESSTENDKELNFGMLKGGLRNKAYARPPYTKNTSNASSSSLEDREVSRGNKGAGLRNISDFDSYDVFSNPQEILTNTHDPSPKKNSSSRAPSTYFDSDDSDSENDPKQNSPSLTRPVGGISRRTSGPSKTGTGLRSKDSPSYKASVTSSAKLVWNSSRVSYESENQKVSSVMGSSKSEENSKPGSVEHLASKQSSETNRSSHEEVMKSSARLQPPSSLPKTVIKDSEEASYSGGDTTPSKQKPDHVHPKLPDYDSFAAHFQSLKKDRR